MPPVSRGAIGELVDYVDWLGRTNTLSLQTKDLEQHAYDEAFQLALERLEAAGLAIEAGEFDRSLRAFSNNLALWRRYKPRARLDCPVVLIRCQDSADTGQPDDLGWSAHVSGEIQRYTVDGDHFSMLTPPRVADLAQLLSLRLR